MCYSAIVFGYLITLTWTVIWTYEKPSFMVPTKNLMLKLYQVRYVLRYVLQIADGPVAKSDNFTPKSDGQHFLLGRPFVKSVYVLLEAAQIFVIFHH